jgi:hypothetical protein
MKSAELHFHKFCRNSSWYCNISLHAKICFPVQKNSTLNLSMEYIWTNVILHSVDEHGLEVDRKSARGIKMW